MNFTNLTRRRPTRPATASRPRDRRPMRPSLDALEGRLMLSVAPQVYTVTNANGSGAGSLAAAVASTNADTYSGGAQDTIQFAPALKGQAISVSGLEVDHAVVIDAGAAPGVSISDPGEFRVFYVATGANLTLDNLTIDEASGVQENPDVVPSSFIRNDGTLTLTDDVLAGNLTWGSQDDGRDDDGANPYSSGALVNYGTATLAGCTFSGNVGGGGGAIDNQGTLTSTDDTFSDNQSVGADCTWSRRGCRGHPQRRHPDVHPRYVLRQQRRGRGRLLE